MSELGTGKIADASSASEAAPIRAHRKTLVASIAMVMLAALTIVLGARFAGNAYLLTSVLLILYVLVPFFVSFEERKPQARELTILAVMTTLAVVGRVAFMWAPNITAITGIVIIAGVALGPLSGFMTGALGSLVSNFICGQGPWTPWQMFAFGITGLLAGILARKGVIAQGNLSRKQLLVFAIASFFFVLFIVGPLLDTCSIFTIYGSIDTSIIALYLAGVPFNVFHALSTAAIIFFFANPLLSKLNHVFVKYGLNRR